MAVKPILDRILIKPQEAETETTGGIIIANPKNEGIIQGEVLDVGPGAHDDKGNFITPGVEVGNVVLINAMSGQKFEHEDVEYIMITESEIVAVLS